ncbi:hypothetical protein K439DRAFT_404912 [Ramaria rubella]|nr:hypothetical protein K439DRAFT_404912 [Ramaria rubella]
MAAKRPLGRPPNIHRRLYLKVVLACRWPQTFEKDQMNTAANRHSRSPQNRWFILDVGLAFRRLQSLTKLKYRRSLRDFMDVHGTSIACLSLKWG